MELITKLQRMMLTFDEACGAAANNISPCVWDGKEIGKAMGMVHALAELGFLECWEQRTLESRAQTSFELMQRNTWPIPEWCIENPQEPLLPWRSDFDNKDDYQKANAEWHLHRRLGPERNAKALAPSEPEGSAYA